MCKPCKLVLYCSKECQQKHWKVHKQDCKEKNLALDWKAAWVRERRTPSFIDDALGANWSAGAPTLGLGIDLWGNVPATDLINLNSNEREPTLDLTVGQFASGDLRNMVQTINNLPPDYTGQLTFLVNDHNPYVVARNLLILLILGVTSDKCLAADMALHLWYSAFLPMEYNIKINTFVTELVTCKTTIFQSKLSDTSNLVSELPDPVKELLVRIATSTYEMGDIANEIHRVRFAPDRVDRHHRVYCRLEPSHRLSFLEFRRFGLVLPFGARNDHFSHPNRFLFSPEGRWLQNDLCTPFDSWSAPAVIKAGCAHGTTRADLFGCLYFYLSDQLREVADRLSRFHISFKFFNKDAGALSRDIRSGNLTHFGVPSSMQFDRIDVSNILDVAYLGLERMCSELGCLLKSTDSATLVGYSINWATRCEDATPGEGDLDQLMSRLQDERKLPLPPQGHSAQELTDYMTTITARHHIFTAVYDNSEAFLKYLESQDLTAALRRAELKIKSKHTIVPHRICAPLDSPASALPEFPNEESLYLNVRFKYYSTQLDEQPSPHLQANVMGPLWTERYVELTRV